MNIDDFSKIVGVDLTPFYEPHDLGIDPEKDNDRIDALQHDIDVIDALLPKKFFFYQKWNNKRRDLIREREKLINNRAFERLWEKYAMEMAIYDYHRSIGRDVTEPVMKLPKIY